MWLHRSIARHFVAHSKKMASRFGSTLAHASKRARFASLAQLDARGRTKMHQYVQENNLFMVGQILSSQDSFCVEPSWRQAIVLSDILGMIVDYHALINQITMSKQTFFPRVEMDSIVQNINLTLAETGGLVNLLDNQCRTLLHVACIHSQPDMVRLLLNSRAILDVEDVYETDAFSYAVRQDCRSTIDLIVPKLRPGNEALKQVTKHLANAHVVETILAQHGLSVDSCDSFRASLLHQALNQSHAETACKLISLGARLDWRDACQHSALHKAVMGRTLDFILPLFQPFGRSLLDARDNEGNTALHLAARLNSLEMSRQLVKAGASRHAANKWNQRPADVAPSYRLKEELRLS